MSSTEHAEPCSIKLPQHNYSKLISQMKTTRVLCHILVTHLKLGILKYLPICQSFLPSSTHLSIWQDHALNCHQIQLVCRWRNTTCVYFSHQVGSAVTHSPFLSSLLPDLQSWVFKHRAAARFQVCNRVCPLTPELPLPPNISYFPGTNNNIIFALQAFRQYFDLLSSCRGGEAPWRQCVLVCPIVSLSLGIYGPPLTQWRSELFFWDILGFSEDREQ